MAQEKATIFRIVEGEKKDGGIAHLVERCLCTAEVSGSSPLTSRKKKGKVANWEKKAQSAGEVPAKEPRKLHRKKKKRR
jgi:hypothetical protein